MIQAGQILQNRYSVETQIGAGGMGAVFQAVDQRFKTRVAIKQTLCSDPEARRAFEREAQLLNGLRHPVLPRVFDYFTEDEEQFLVMEYIAGDDLFEIVKRDGAFAAADVLRWADGLLDALEYLHNQKFPVVHRDIKPQNLKLTPRGEIILLDFGLAKGSASEFTFTSMAKSIYGFSRLYAPLEQIQGTGTDPRSDLYALGATLFHLITGEPPVDALTRATAMVNADSDPQPLAAALNADVPTPISLALDEALAMNAKLRPASAAAMRALLARAAEQPASFAAAKTSRGRISPVTAAKNLTIEDAVTEIDPDSAALQLMTARENNETNALATARRARFGLKKTPPPASIAAAAILLVGAIGFIGWTLTNQPASVSAVPTIETPNNVPAPNGEPPASLTAATETNAPAANVVVNPNGKTYTPQSATETPASRRDQARTNAEPPSANDSAAQNQAAQTDTVRNDAPPSIKSNQPDAPSYEPQQVAAPIEIKPTRDANSPLAENAADDAPPALRPRSNETAAQQPDTAKSKKQKPRKPAARVGFPPPPPPPNRLPGGNGGRRP